MKQCSYFAAFLFFTATVHSDAKPFRLSDDGVRSNVRSAISNEPKYPSKPEWRSIPVDGAKSLILDGNFSCEYRQGTKPKVMIRCLARDESLVGKTVSQDSIHLSINGASDRPIFVTIVLPALSEVVVRGKCQFRATEIHLQSFKVTVADEGNAQFGGEIQNLQVLTSDAAICSINSSKVENAFVLSKDVSMVNGSAIVSKLHVQGADAASIGGKLQVRNLECILDDQSRLQVGEVGKTKYFLNGDAQLKVTEPGGTFVVSSTGELLLEKPKNQSLTSTAKAL